VVDGGLTMERIAMSTARSCNRSSVISVTSASSRSTSAMLFLCSAAATPVAISGWHKYSFESRGVRWSELVARPSSVLVARGALASETAGTSWSMRAAVGNSASSTTDSPSPCGAVGEFRTLTINSASSGEMYPSRFTSNEDDASVPSPSRPDPLLFK